MKAGIIIWLAVTVLFASCSGPSEGQHLRIAAAANLQYAVTDIIQPFEDQYGVTCDLVVGSSGKLAAQIVEGAPYDVFLSADQRYPFTLSDEGLTAGSVKVYAYGKLVLWSARDRDATDIHLLGAKKYERIALANPALAPYGRAAFQALKQSGMLQTITDKLVYGESIAQTNQFISTGAADAAFTSLSAWRPGENRRIPARHGHYTEVDPGLYDPIVQSAVVLKNDRQDLAAEFIAFLGTTKAKSILKAHGYGIPED